MALTGSVWVSGVGRGERTVRGREDTQKGKTHGVAGRRRREEVDIKLRIQRRLKAATFISSSFHPPADPSLQPASFPCILLGEAPRVSPAAAVATCAINLHVLRHTLATRALRQNPISQWAAFVLQRLRLLRRHTLPGAGPIPSDVSCGVAGAWACISAMHSSCGCMSFPPNCGDAERYISLPHGQFGGDGALGGSGRGVNCKAISMRYQPNDENTCGSFTCPHWERSGWKL
ncbi:hypothetical protein B0H11DRAFT_2417209 [Mycena galericulata]|nr:hypothetical protein B0H11DRAFT_2417209 [Mycena galericulata]